MARRTTAAYIDPYNLAAVKCDTWTLRDPKAAYRFVFNFSIKCGSAKPWVLFSVKWILQSPAKVLLLFLPLIPTNPPSPNFLFPFTFRHPFTPQPYTQYSASSLDRMLCIIVCLFAWEELVMCVHLNHAVSSTVLSAAHSHLLNANLTDVFSVIKCEGNSAVYI